MAFDYETWGKLGLAAYQAYSSNQAGKEEQQGLRDARNATTGSSADAIAELRRQSLQARSDLAPYNAGGQSSFNAYLRTLGIAPSSTTGGLVSGSARGDGGSGNPFAPGWNAGPETREYKKPSAGGNAASGAATGAQLGSSFGPWGTVIGGAIGGIAGYFGTGEGGDLATGTRAYATPNGIIWDAKGNIVARVKVPESGTTPIPGLSRNGHDVLIDSKGNLLKGTAGKGTDYLGLNINSLSKDGPTEIDGVIAKGYTPETATEADYKLSPVETGSASGFTPTGNVNEDRYGGFYQSPGYKFLFDETMRGGRAAGSARGGLYSGRLIKELERRAAGIASQDFGGYQDNLFRSAQLGANAASGQANTANNTGTNVANIITGTGSTLADIGYAAGQSRGSSIVSNSQNLGSLFGTAIDAYNSTKKPDSGGGTDWRNDLQKYIDEGNIVG